MLCVFIATPGEEILGYNLAKNLGYDVEVYSSTQDTSELTDKKYEQSKSYLNGKAPEIYDSQTHRPHVRSLRASWIKLLSDPRYKNREDVIFCESDCIPLIPEIQLRNLLNAFFSSNYDADVIRPFEIFKLMENDYNGLDDIIDDIDEIKIVKKHKQYKNADDPALWGTHALIIPCNKREKIINIFKDYRLPTDIALQCSNAAGEINLYITNKSLFVQKKQIKKDKKLKVGVLLSSYKRLVDLQRQILCMVNQDYEDLHVFVAAKGITDAVMTSVLLPSVQPYIDKGRLTVRSFTNKSQLNNLLDTVRDLYLDDYDFFTKIDDDDFYSSDYISTIVELHKMLPYHISSNLRIGGLVSIQNGYHTISNDLLFNWYGNALFFTKQVLDTLFLYEQSKEKAILELGPHTYNYLQYTNFNTQEDKLIEFIMSQFGAITRDSYILSAGKENSMYIRRGDHASITQGGNYSSGIYTDENVNQICHPAWSSIIKINRKHVINLVNNDTAKVLSQSDKHITLQWPRYNTIETFYKNRKGIYTL